MPIPDQLRIQRLKRQKLQMKDQIRILSAEVNPDIIA
ncbi:MAG: YdcH family protein [Pseudomonadota bacterium]